MDCRRAEELFSDHLDGTLPAPLRAELELHLAACEPCRLLREALAEVVAALHALPLVDAPRRLAERAAGAALAERRRRPVAVSVPSAPPPRMPVWLQALAATLAIALSGGLAAGSHALGSSTRLGARLAERSASVGSFLVERKERLVEDVRLLRAVVGTAFEERLDRVGERVDDYRRLLERRRAREQQEQQKKLGPDSSRDFLNPRDDERVHQCESGPDSAHAGAAGEQL